MTGLKELLSKENEDIFQKGIMARLAGEAYLTNPYSDYSKRKFWSDGWTWTDTTIRTGKEPDAS